MDRTRAVLCAALACLLGLWPGPARAEDGHTLEVTVRWSDGHTNTWSQVIREDEGRDIAARPDTVAGKYLLTARQKLAEKQGYTAAIYGPDYWKIPQVAKWFFELRDPRANRVIASNRP